MKGSNLIERSLIRFVQTLIDITTVVGSESVTVLFKPLEATEILRARNFVFLNLH